LRKCIVFILSFFIIYTAVQLVSGMFLTLRYTPDIEKLWEGSNITNVEQSSSIPTFIMIFISAGISLLIMKLYIKFAK
jgi:hypothetical protein